MEKNPELYEFGYALFRSQALSGASNISCLSCHDLSQAGTDARPLPIGQNGKILPRHSPHLFNLGDPAIRGLFADLRVFSDGTFIRHPVPKIATHARYTDLLKTPLELQVLVPMLDPDEMLGRPGTNEIADLKDPFEIWGALAERVWSDRDLGSLGRRAFVEASEPGMPEIAKALAHFISVRFAANETPFDHYIKGEDKALSETQKRGALVFYDKGKCVQCHSGAALSDHFPHNVAFPTLGEGKHGKGLDFGAVFVSTAYDAYSIRTPTLRNVSLTAPYGHTGSFLTLEEVIEHYRDPVKSLKGYTPEAVNSVYEEEYGIPLPFLTTSGAMDQVLANLSKIVAPKIEISDEEKADLIEFLRFGLLDRSFEDR